MKGMNIFFSRQKGSMGYLSTDHVKEKGYTYKFFGRRGVCEHEDSLCSNKDVVEYNPNTIYYLGLDMSFNQAGLAVGHFEKILGKKPRFVVDSMIDVIRDSSMTSDDYMAHLKVFFKQNFTDVKLGLVVMEESLYAKKSKMTSKSLEQLQGLVKGCKDIFGTEIITIEPSTWRACFLADPRYTGRKKSTLDCKLSAGEETVRRHPELEAYTILMRGSSKASQGYVCDSCDAVGVIEGYIGQAYAYDSLLYGLNKLNENLEENVDLFKKLSPFTMPARTDMLEPGVPLYPRVCSVGMMQVNQKINMCALAFKPSNLKCRDEVREFPLYEAIPNLLRRGIRYHVFNYDMSLEDNMYRVTSGYSDGIETFIVRPGSRSQALEWKTKIRLKDDEVYLLFCYRVYAKKKEESLMDILEEI